MDTYLTINSARLWITTNGKGPVCILCNGGPGCDDYLGPVSGMIEDLCTTVRFEPRGCGRSDYDGKYDLDTTLEDIDRIRQELETDEILIGGHSHGSNLAMAYTLRHPEHVKGFFGITGARIVNDREWSKVYKRNLEEVGEDPGGNVFTSDPNVNVVGNASWREFIQHETLLRDIARIRSPALFVNAGQDIRPNWPTKQLARLIPDARYEEIPGAAHTIWLTHADELKVVLRRFITGLFKPDTNG